MFGTAFTAAETALLLLIASILGLFLVTVLVCAYAVILRSGHARRDRLWEELSRRWEGPVLAAILDPEKIPEAQAQVSPEHRLHFVNYVLQYTRRVRGEERRAMRRLAEPYLELLVPRARDRRSEVRTRAVQTLGTLGLPRYADVVIEGLDDESPLVSMVAARYLARAEFPQFAPIVLRHLTRFEGWNRRFLASMLAEIGPEASSSLREAMVDEQTPAWLRGVHAEALAMQMDPQSADPAATALAMAEDRELVSALLRLLAAVGRPEHLPPIRARCAASDVFVRAQALHALGELGGESDIPFLVEAMDDPSPWVALHAARGVKAAGGEKALVELAASDHPSATLAGQVLDEEDDA